MNSAADRIHNPATVCRACYAKLPAVPFFDLGEQPLANNLENSLDAAVRAPRAPLALVRCLSCGLVQLTAVVDPRRLFSNYLYTPSQSSSFQRHFSEMARELAAEARLGPEDLALDIGANDGLLLRLIREQSGARVLGVEPAENLTLAAAKDGVEELHAYWGQETAKYVRDFWRARHDAPLPKLITANNVLAHCDDWHGFFWAVRLLLHPDGICSIEVPGLLEMLRDGTFDLIYHEHLSYVSLAPLIRTLARARLEIFRVETQPVHGGSIRVLIRHQEQGGADRSVGDRLRMEGALDTSRFADQAKRTRDRLIQTVRALRPAYGWTAPAKATTLCNYAGFTGGDIPFIVDDSPLKQGKWMPGTGIPITGPEDALPAEAAVLWAWNLGPEVIQEKLRPRIRYVILPMPEVRVIDLQA